MAERPVIGTGVPLTVGAAARRVLAEQARALRRHGRHARRGHDPEDVHQMRVATRRLRAVLRTLRAHLDQPPKLRRGLRRLAARLGEVRDADVILALLEGSHVQDVPGIEGRRLETLVRRLRRRRGRARTALVRALERPGHRRLMDRLERFAQRPRVSGDPDTPVARVLGDAITRLAAEVAREPGLERPSPDADALHRLRIAFKRLRYVLEFHAAAGGPAYEVEMRLARELQDVLGHVHDHDLLLGWLEEGRGAFAGPWPLLGERLRHDRRRWYQRFLRLRRAWLARTAPASGVAPIEEPRFVHLEPKPVTLRLVGGTKSVASGMIVR
jgi:CHAD domain-containing protein